MTYNVTLSQKCLENTDCRGFKATYEGMVSAQALGARLLDAGRKYTGVVHFNEGHLTGLCQRLYASLEDGCAKTVAEEWRKIERVRRAERAMARLKEVCEANVYRCRAPETWTFKIVGEAVVPGERVFFCF
jgi:hypothetical protein